MKITFQTTAAEQKTYSAEEKKNIKQTTKNTVVSGAAYAKGEETGWGKNTKQGKSLIELQQDAANTDVAVQRDYMTVMSNTMSEEDYAQMEKEGFHFESLDPETAVTIVDKIKAELARSGQEIVGYTDDMDTDTLAAAVGSTTLAQAITVSFQQADVPLTEENIRDVAQAWTMASQLTPMSDGEYGYLIDNEMKPEIWNVYLAQNSGADMHTASTAPRYYAEDVQGYFAESAGTEVEESLKQQIDKVIEQSGMPLTDENRQSGKWLLQNGLPLTKENLSRLQELQKIALPVREEQFAEVAANAVANGQKPIHGNLSDEKSVYKKASEVLAYYQQESVETAGNDITARRQLEEIRLRMTAEVNVKLIESGFSIDTAPMEELVEALKRTEEELAGQYFPNDEQAVSKYESYKETTTVLAELPQLPAASVGPWSASENQGTLKQFHTEGKNLQAIYEKAQTEYEALMTAPRSDMGDSIKKAFANVDEILKDLGFTITEENQKAVRILGYNGMEMTEANVEQVKAAYEQVERVVQKMTPGATLQMIREGVNPLEKTFPELEQYFASQPEEYSEQAESYSRFLYSLEQNKAITNEERDSFIGVYRLIHQIENGDGAAVGALVNTQAEIHFSNLLSAVRSGKFKKLDVKVSDAVGEVTDRIQKGESISEQIGKAFVKDVNRLLTQVSQETEGAYGKQKLEVIRQAVTTDEECASLLSRGQISASADNLLATQALLQDSTTPFHNLKNKKEKMTNMSDKEAQMEMGQVWETLEDKQSFEDDYQQLVSEVTEMIEQTSLEEADSSVDVRELQLLHKQMNVLGSLAKSEEYFVPMYIGEELARVHLTVENGNEKKGNVRISIEMANGSSLTGSFYLKEGHITGALTENTGTEVTKLEEIADKFKKEAEENWAVDELHIVDEENFQLEEMSTIESSENTPGSDNAELYRVAKAFLQSVK